MATVNIDFDASSMQALDDAGFYPEPFVHDIGTVTQMGLAFSDAGNEVIDLGFMVPIDIDTAATVTFRIFHYAVTAVSSKNTQYRFSHRAIANSEAQNGAYTNEDSGNLAMDATQTDETVSSWTETVTNLGWAARDKIIAQLARIAAVSSELSGDDLVTRFVVEIPLS